MFIIMVELVEECAMNLWMIYGVRQYVWIWHQLYVFGFYVFLLAKFADKSSLWKFSCLSDSKFTQQELPACKPILTPQAVNMFVCI